MGFGGKQALRDDDSAGSESSCAEWQDCGDGVVEVGRGGCGLLAMEAQGLRVISAMRASSDSAVRA